MLNVSVDLPEDIKIFVRVDFLNYKFVSPTDHECVLKNYAFME